MKPVCSPTKPRLATFTLLTLLSSQLVLSSPCLPANFVMLSRRTPEVETTTTTQTPTIYLTYDKWLQQYRNFTGETDQAVVDAALVADTIEVEAEDELSESRKPKVIIVPGPYYPNNIVADDETSPKEDVQTNSISAEQADGVNNEIHSTPDVGGAEEISNQATLEEEEEEPETKALDPAPTREAKSRAGSGRRLLGEPANPNESFLLMPQPLASSAQSSSSPSQKKPASVWKAALLVLLIFAIL